MLDLLREPVVWLLHIIDLPILVYFLCINTSYLVLTVLAALELARHIRRLPFAGLEEAYASPLTQPVSVLMPAYNEEVGIVESVRAMLGLRYPEFEVIVVDDGSTDGMVARLQASFRLVQVPRVVPEDVAARGRVLEVWIPGDGVTPLVLVRKENGGRADALNAGVNAAQYPLVCMVDADSLLDPDALLTVSKPFADDPLHVIGTGGVIRAVNGCRVRAGRVVDIRMPKDWVARIQVVEYLRAFLLGRTGWSKLGALPLISGAFGLFRRDIVVAVGGFDPDSLGEDFELVTHMHRHMREKGVRDYRLVFVAEPVSWTEVPSTLKVLARQRRRWHRGLMQVLWRHRVMLLNPRYGRIGLFALPYYVLFELLAPVLELFGMFIVPIGLLVGAVNVPYALLFLSVAYGYAMLVSVAALAVEEFSFHRYSRWRDLGLAIAAAVLENFGYRQLTCLWRIQGLWSHLLRKKAVWGVMPRAGFDTGPDEVLATRAGTSP
jgi:cellulose synthase/poly-beta-1,6-N-acetylglucosamine synthase-like glycosyltransferase